MESRIYKSSDFNLVAFLCARGLEFKSIECSNKKNMRCTFILIVPKSVNFRELLNEWGSPETEKIRKFAHQSKILRSELKKFFTNSEKGIKTKNLYNNG